MRPAAELADPGPRGTFEPTPARLAEFALDVSRAFIIDRVEDSTGEAQGMGVAQGMGEAQGVGVAQDIGVTEFVGENDAILHNDSEDTDVTDSHAKFAIDYFGKFVLGPVGECVPDSGTRQDDRHSWPAHRWPPGHCDPGSRPVRGACVCYPESTVAQCGSSRRPMPELHSYPIRGFGPDGETKNTTTEKTTTETTTIQRPSGKQDFLSLYRCSEAQEGQQRSIDEDAQRSSIRGKVCSCRGSRPKISDQHQRWYSFGPYLYGCYSVQSDEPCAGIRSLSHRRQCRLCIPTMFCHPLSGPCDRQSVARSVGECLNGITISTICSMCRGQYSHAWSKHEYMRRHEHSCIHISCCLLGSRFF